MGSILQEMFLKYFKNLMWNIFSNIEFVLYFLIKEGTVAVVIVEMEATVDAVVWVAILIK